MRHKTMTYGSTLIKAAKDDDGFGHISALVSVFGNVDHDGDRIVSGAFKETLAQWRAKGDPIPFIWSHQWSDPRAHVGWIPPDKAQETGRGLEVEALMRLTDPDAAKVYELLADRRVTQFSFAYDILEEEETDEETDRGWGGNVYELTKLALYECGPCLLGANEETELLEVAARRLTRKDGRVLSGANYQKLVDARDAIDQVIQSAEHEEDSRKVKGAIGYSSSGTSDAAWDASANVSALGDDPTAAQLRAMHAWVDPDGDPAVRSSYKFPHHFATGGRVGAASTRACSSAIAALNGARGGANIPAGDRQGVYNHVAHHLRDADMEPPDLASVEDAEAASAPPPELAELEAIAVTT